MFDCCLLFYFKLIVSLLLIMLNQSKSHEYIDSQHKYTNRFAIYPYLQLFKSLNIEAVVISRLSCNGLNNLIIYITTTNNTIRQLLKDGRKHGSWLRDIIFLVKQSENGKKGRKINNHKRSTCHTCLHMLSPTLSLYCISTSSTYYLTIRA